MKNEFNAAFKTLRKNRGITQEQLAEAVGVSPQAVSKWEMNGYPDAPLLPVIAEYLGVSVDELFGNVKEDIPIGQRVIEYIENEPEEERLDAAMEIAWAINLSLMGAHKNEYKPCEVNCNIPDEPFGKYNIPFSEQITEKGFCQSRLGNNLKYFLLLPEPECGYDDILGYNEKFLELYGFLTVPNALRTMYMFAGKSEAMFFSVDSLVKELDIDKKNAEEIIDKMMKLNLAVKASLDTGDGKETIYHDNVGINFISFMTFSYILLNRPYNYYNKTRNRDGDNAYFKQDTYKSEKNSKKNQPKE